MDGSHELFFYNKYTIYVAYIIYLIEYEVVQYISTKRWSVHILFEIKCRVYAQVN